MGMMRQLTTIPAMLLLGASLVGPAEAQRGRAAPADLEAVFEPLETQVEDVRGGTRITFGDWSYTISGDRNALGPGNIRIRGRACWYEGHGRRPGWLSGDIVWRHRLHTTPDSWS